MYSIFPPHPPKEASKDPLILSGIIHVHSNYSDGGGSPLEVAQAGVNTKRDFVVLTDHMNTGARRDGFEKRYGNTDLFIEAEGSHHAGHSLIFSSHTGQLEKVDDNTQNDIGYIHATIGRDNKEDMFTIVSHPSNLRNPWTLSEFSAEGMEVINFDTLWQHQVKHHPLVFLSTALGLLFNEYLATIRFLDITRRNFEIFDSITALPKRRFAILAQDTHAKLILSKNTILKWPGYESTFRLASNLVRLSDPPQQDFPKRKLQIYRAISQGHSNMVFDVVYPYKNINWWVQCNDERFYVGSHIEPKTRPCRLNFQLPTGFPYGARLDLWRNGKQVSSHILKEERFEQVLTRPGIYRIEVYAQVRSLFHVLLNWDVPYFFTNPIYLN